MNRLLTLATTALVAFSLLSCSALTTTRVPYMKDDLASELWVRYIDSHPAAWVVPAELTTAGTNSEYIRIGSVNTLHINGNFKVLIEKTTIENSVTISGEKRAIKSVGVEQKGGDLYISESVALKTVKDVLVTIRLNNFNNLIVKGGVLVQGRGLHSSNLYVDYAGSGYVYLDGQYNLRRVVQTGSGNLTILGVDSSWVDIDTSGIAGVTRIAGNYNIKSLHHTGGNSLILTGAYSDNLIITAGGSGRISVNGQVSLSEIHTSGSVWVMSDNVTSGMIRVFTKDNSVVAMMGNVSTLYVETSQNSRFFGRYLCSDSAFIRTFDMSHVNISARLRIFASASENSSIYYFGVPGILSPFSVEHAIIIPFWVGGSPYCFARSSFDRYEHASRARENPRAIIPQRYAPLPPPASDSRLEFKSQFKGAG